jgi:hypothetical protein
MYVELGQAALAMYQERKTINSVFASIAHVVANGRTRIALFGLGGTGKTTLGSVLSNTFDSRPNPGSYDVSPREETSALESIPLGQVIVAPGQERRRSHYWPPIKREISAGNVDVIIFVASYGYNSIDVENTYQEQKYYAQGMTPQQFLPHYLEEIRKEEIQVLDNDLRDCIETSSNKIRMLTVITKQDLWWDQRSQVKQHYQFGNYDTIIEKIRKKRGEHHFDHDYISVCLESVNFITKDNQPNQPPNSATFQLTISGYDSILQRANLNNLHNRILTLCKRS